MLKTRFCPICRNLSHAARDLPASMKVNKRNFIQSAIYICLLLIICFSSAYAHPFLWKATGEHSFYMLGTIHLPDPRITNLPAEVENTLEESTAFYAELDLSESNIVEIAQLMWLPQGKTLFDILPISTQTNVSELLAGINPAINLEMFSNQKVWALAVTLTLLEQQLKYPGQPPLDIVLYEKSSKQGKITGGLETIHEQMNIFEDMSVDEQLRLLDDTIEFMQQAQLEETSVAERSVNAYLQGDLDRLMRYLTSYMKDEPFYQNLLSKLMDERNKKMTETILSLVKQNPDQTFFFAIGAGHFWGANGINSLLKKQGYSIETISAN